LDYGTTVVANAHPKQRWSTITMVYVDTIDFSLQYFIVVLAKNLNDLLPVE